MNHYPAISNRLLKFFLENEVSRPLLTHSMKTLSRLYNSGTGVSSIDRNFESTTMKLKVQDMSAIPELAMPRSHKVTTIYNGRREVWTDYEEAKAYFLELMMTTDGEEHERC